jgi:regulatory protein
MVLSERDSDAAGPTDTTVGAVDIRRAAMDLLARREHSVRELHNKLIQRFGDSPLISPELERLREERLQSDERFVEAYVYSRARKLYGPVRIKAELRERGISDTVIAASLKASDIDWHANLQQLIDTRFGPGPAADFKEKARRLRFLQYRGFSADDIGEFVL